MITIKKLEIYNKYSGDIEGWDRFGKREDKKKLTYEEWELIDELIHGLELIDKGLASDGFKSQVLNKLREVCDTQQTENKLKILLYKY